jgi:hypothetical protein
MKPSLERGLVGFDVSGVKGAQRLGVPRRNVKNTAFRKIASNRPVYYSIL